MQDLEAQASATTALSGPEQSHFVTSPEEVLASLSSGQLAYATTRPKSASFIAALGGRHMSWAAGAAASALSAPAMVMVVNPLAALRHTSSNSNSLDPAGSAGAAQRRGGRVGRPTAARRRCWNAAGGTRQRRRRTDLRPSLSLSLNIGYPHCIFTTYVYFGIWPRWRAGEGGGGRGRG